MFIFTHIKIANYFYSHIQSVNQGQKMTFELDPIAFAYGSIKPDISKMAGVNHHLYETFEIYLEHLNKSQDDAYSHRQRSQALGVAVHFMCDYFCKYHAKSPYKEQGKVKHFFYEWKLHLNVGKNFLKRVLYTRHNLSDINAYTKKNRIQDPTKTMIEMVTELDLKPNNKFYYFNYRLKAMLMDYQTREESTSLDRDFALAGVNDLLTVALGVRALATKDEYLQRDDYKPVYEQGAHIEAQREAVNENRYIYGYFSTTSERGDQYLKEIG